MNEINWGIIGCGDVTEVKSGPAFQKVPHSKLVAVMRRNGEKAADYARRHKVPKWYSDADALLQDKDINAVYIATPPSSHEEYATRALKAGKDVYLEKPMALHAASAKKIADAAKETGRKVSIAHYRRQQPLFLKIKSMIDSGALGEINFVNMTLFQPHQDKMVAQTDEAWRLDPRISGGGLFHDLAPHGLDLMLYFFGTPTGATGSASNTGKLYATEDSVIGRMTFPGDITFKGSWCFVVPEEEKEDDCKIYGTKGSLRFSIFDRKPLSWTRDLSSQTFSFDLIPHVQQPMIQRVVEYFRGEAPNPCSADEGVEVMKIMDAFTKRKP